MTEPTVVPRHRLPSSVLCAVVGVAVAVTCVLALFLPGQNIHGGKVTSVVFLVALSVPPLCFAVGLIVAIRRRHQSGNLGAWLNSAGLGLYVLWVTGALTKLMGQA